MFIDRVMSVLAVAQSCATWKWGPSGSWTEYHGGSSRIEYTTVTGFFLQDEASTDPNGFDYSATNFGLIRRAYPTDGALADAAGKTQWERFEHYVDALNARADERTQYKVLIMGRHGEGYHNAAETFYGTPAWDCYWAQLDGNGTVVWKDAHLTDAGAAQAAKANRFWAGQLAAQGQPAPQRYYTSPLWRCLQTASLTFGGLALPAARPFVPTIKELMREDISTHTCDHRSTKADIHGGFPSFVFEPGFAERDELWTGTTAETDEARDARSRALLDDIFDHDDSTWLSFTSHSGEITSLLRVLGHRAFALSTGQIIPVLVRARSLRDEDPPTATASYPWDAVATCDSPPVTSVSGQGCVCSSAATTTSVPASATAGPPGS